ncbi:RDD family protein [Lentisphaera profundi]|uniref:RDD family protein n=1 Tax=Lentisphaera profundi TaxID=1658616 RepID=A0ABY7VZV9_9BACT|nr:RDD family protein [Lentisphaera profundi]WDE98321.1 RDD family protein [Lentisphaera profundi]
MGEKIDTIFWVETPEGVNLSMRLASLPVRMTAFLLDLIFRVIIFIVLAIVLGFLGDASQGLILVSIFILWWFYPVLFEVLQKGMTPGKRIMKIRVLHGNGTPVGWKASMIRNFLRLADLMASVWGLEFIAMFADSRNRRLGDLAADTIVVYTDSQRSKVFLPEVMPLLPPVPLNSEEQKSFIAFGERYHMLSKQRQVELAEILEEMHGETGAAAVKKLYAYSLGLAGGEGVKDS